MSVIKYWPCSRKKKMSHVFYKRLLRYYVYYLGRDVFGWVEITLRLGSDKLWTIIRYAYESYTVHC